MTSSGIDWADIRTKLPYERTEEQKKKRMDMFDRFDPKCKYISFADFSKKASKNEIEGFFKAVGKIAEDQNLVAEGYRILANHGINAGQEVPHFHVHILGGETLKTIS